MGIELPQLTVEQKWEKAESNLIYFIASGITYARSLGQTAEDFGVWAGQVAAPFWEEEKSPGSALLQLVEGISHNKQQFHGFTMEILEESDRSIRARMKSFGEDMIRQYPLFHVSVDEYIRFFEKKWIVIADCLGLEYKQQVDGDWVVFTVTQRSGF